jgi:hypothetical protein
MKTNRAHEHRGILKSAAFYFLFLTLAFHSTNVRAQVPPDILEGVFSAGDPEQTGPFRMQVHYKVGDGLTNWWEDLEWSVPDIFGSDDADEKAYKIRKAAPPTDRYFETYPGPIAGAGTIAGGWGNVVRVKPKATTPFGQVEYIAWFEPIIDDTKEAHASTCHFSASNTDSQATNVARLLFDQPTANGKLTVRVEFTDGNCVSWRTANILKTDDPDMKGDKIRQTAPQRDHYLATDPDSLTIAGGDGALLEVRSKNGHRIKSIAVINDTTNQKEVLSHIFALNGSPVESQGVLAFSGRAVGTNSQGLPSSVSVKLRGSELSIVAESGASSTELEGLLRNRLIAAGFAATNVQTTPSQPYHGLVGHGHLLVVGNVDDRGFGYVNTDAGITLDVLATVNAAFDEAPKPYLGIKAEGAAFSVEFEGILQAKNQLGGPWLDVADRWQSPWQVSANQSQCFFRARVEPVTIGSLNVIAGPPGGVLTLSGVVQGNHRPYTLRVRFPWGTQVFRAGTEPFEILTTIPTFVEIGENLLELNVQDHLRTYATAFASFVVSGGNQPP